MATRETPINPPRIQAAPLLARRFIRDYDAVVQQYALKQQLEITEHLLGVLDIFLHQEESDQNILYKRYQEREEALLKRYGKTLKPYMDKHFYKYFDFTMVLAEKDIYLQEEFNRLTAAEHSLTVNEINQFLHICHNSLYNAKTFLYLDMEPEATELIAKGTGLPEPAEQDKDITKARQLLAIYYLLKVGFAIEHRDNNSVSAVTRLAHLLTGTKFTNLQNSDIYKKYSLIPYYKKGDQLIADLQFIRPSFAELNIHEAVRLIDEEINDTRKRLSKR